VKYLKCLLLKRIFPPLLFHREFSLDKSFVVLKRFPEREVTPTKRTKEMLWKEAQRGVP